MSYSLVTRYQCRQLWIFYVFVQGIIDWTGTETFAKEPKLAKLLREHKSNACAVSLKKFTGFSRMSVIASLLCFGCFPVGQHVNGGFFANIDVGFYWPACIDHWNIYNWLVAAAGVECLCFTLEKHHCFWVSLFPTLFVCSHALQLTFKSSV